MSKYFDDNVPLAGGAKNSLAMSTVKQGSPLAQARPKGRIVGKDNAREVYEDIAILPTGDFVVGYRGQYIHSPCGLQVRRRSDLSLIDEMLGVAGPFDFDHSLLCSGPLYEGRDSSMAVVNVAERVVLKTLPLCRPFLCLPGARLIGQTPSYFPELDAHPQVAPTLLQQYPQLKKQIEQPDRKLLILNSKNEAEMQVFAKHIGPEFAEFVHIALSPDKGTLYAATCCSVGAVDLSSNQVLWGRKLGESIGSRFIAIYAMGLSPDGEYLAVGGLTGHENDEHCLAVLSVKDGATILNSECFSQWIDGEVRSLTWHPTGWLAFGTNRGQLGFVDLNGTARLFKGASRVIESLLFYDDQLLLCTREPQFRIIPLLADELSPGVPH